MSAPFTAPAKGSDEYEAWLDGPMPDAANGRGAWLGGRSARSSKAKRDAVADGAKAGGAAAQTRMAAGSGQPVGDAPSRDAATALADDPNYAALRRIRDDTSAHDSDRIRAIDGMRRMEVGAAEGAEGPSALVALRQVLDTLAPHERLAWLQGERIAHMHEQAQA